MDALIGDSTRVKDESDRLEETDEDSEKTESPSSDVLLPTDEADSSDNCSVRDVSGEAVGSTWTGKA